MTAAIAPVLRYPGGKARIAPWIVDHLPPHRLYIEPYAGGLGVLLTKPPSAVEIANDLDQRVVTFWRVLRDRPEELIRMVAGTPVSRWEFDQSDEWTGDELEDARRFVVRVWQAFGVKIGGSSGWDRGGRLDTKRRSLPAVWAGLPDRLAAVVDRLRHVQLECKPALDLIASWSVPDALLYIDPPYVESTLGGDRLYRHTMTEADHLALLEALDRHPGPVVLSGYRCEIYDDRLTGWRRIDRPALAQLGAKRTESLWLNPTAAAAAKQLPMNLKGHEA